MARPKADDDEIRTIYWSTRLTPDESEELLKFAQILKRAKAINKISKYSITQFALVKLIRTLRKQFGEV